MPDGMLLELSEVHVHYGKVEALRGVSLFVASGEIVTLIGANGAGKTTTLKTISGVRRLSSGSICFEGRNLAGVPAHELVAMGISQAPEGRAIFPGMSVEENLEMGCYARRGVRATGSRGGRATGSRGGRATGSRGGRGVERDGIAADFERVYGLFPRLAERRRQPGGTLSGGEQQMLAIGRALMARPKVLLLDEPSMGLGPKLVAQIFEIVTEINNQGTTILLVEQNAAQALRRAHRAYVMETGRIVKTAPAAELLDDDTVRNAYLGGDFAADR